jgi:tRNA dimethylallyltransferase
MTNQKPGTDNREPQTANRGPSHSGLPRVVALVGPTGAGKTELGIAIAERCAAEIINADSRQIYRGLDVGSAKPTAAQRARVPHHLVDIVAPTARFDCAQFRRLALAAAQDISRRGKRVLLVGGTGLYVRAVLHGLFDGPGCDLALRARLQGLEDAAPGSLHRRLTQVDPRAAMRLHPHDRVRLVRALEVYELTGQPLSHWQARHGFGERSVEAVVLALSLPRQELYARINARCESMVRAGLVEEVRALYAAGLDPALPALRSPGYREIGEYVRGLCDLPTALARMARATRRLAKRQLTWLRADPHVVWCPPDTERLTQCAQEFWSGATREARAPVP